MKVAMVAKGALLLTLVCNIAISGKFLTPPLEICVQWRCQKMHVIKWMWCAFFVSLFQTTF
jgi:hypothetical protein